MKKHAVVCAVLCLSWPALLISCVSTQADAQISADEENAAVSDPAAAMEELYEDSSVSGENSAADDSENAPPSRIVPPQKGGRSSSAADSEASQDDPDQGVSGRAAASPDSKTETVQQPLYDSYDYDFSIPTADEDPAAIASETAEEIPVPERDAPARLKNINKAESADDMSVSDKSAATGIAPAESETAAAGNVPDEAGNGGDAAAFPYAGEEAGSAAAEPAEEYPAFEDPAITGIMPAEGEAAAAGNVPDEAENGGDAAAFPYAGEGAGSAAAEPAEEYPTFEDPAITGIMPAEGEAAAAGNVPDEAENGGDAAAFPYAGEGAGSAAAEPAEEYPAFEDPAITGIMPAEGEAAAAGNVPDEAGNGGDAAAFPYAGDGAGSAAAESAEGYPAFEDPAITGIMPAEGEAAAAGNVPDEAGNGGDAAAFPYAGEGAGSAAAESAEEYPAFEDPAITGIMPAEGETATAGRVPDEAGNGGDAAAFPYAGDGAGSAAAEPAEEYPAFEDPAITGITPAEGETAADVFSDEPEVASAFFGSVPVAEDEPQLMQEGPSSLSADLPGIPSRSVEMCIGQYLKVSYPGRGWQYLGEPTAQHMLLNYSGRVLDSTNTVFTLRSRRSGTSVLHFSKMDQLTGTYIEDYLEVTVLDAYSSPPDSLVTAPDYAAVVPAGQGYLEAADTGGLGSGSLDASDAPPRSSYTNIPDNDAPSSVPGSGSGIPAGTPQIPPSDRESEVNALIQGALSSPSAGSDAAGEGTLSADGLAGPAAETGGDLFALAGAAYKSGDYVQAAKHINEYLQTAPMDQMDKALYLKGMIYEAKSDIQDIKTALSAYRAVIIGWPESSVWEEASRRAVYIERFYFDIP